MDAAPRCVEFAAGQSENGPRRAILILCFTGKVNEL